MLKVVIADDEVRICQLIKALIDWESMGMEIVGTAGNGLEALELLEKLKPNLLITDIRMPGCNGLELIEKVKSIVPECEIIIISGYAHFEYAQNAIKFGVGDYLLKPVNQSELYATLRKLKERIIERCASESDMKQLLQKNAKDIQRLQMNLMEQLADQRTGEISLTALRDEYYLNVMEGLFQAFIIKIDGKIEELSEAALAIVMERVQSLIKGSLRAKCDELIIYQKDSSCIGVMNYQKHRVEEIRRIFRECVNQLEAQKNLYGPITFSGAMGSIIKTPEGLEESVKEALLIIRERLVKGTGRVLDKLPRERTMLERNLSEEYMRKITCAIEVLNIEEADNAVIQMKEKLNKINNLCGQEIWELITGCGRLFLSYIKIKQREEEIKRFEKICGNCGTLNDLLDSLISFQRRHLGVLIQRYENDTIRPVRQAKQYIQNHFSEQITMEEVAGNVGLSATYFSVLFKKTEGEGFARYLINIRVEEAKRLLRESNDSVTKICHNVGYHDLKHFTHTFEKITGVKPTMYRKLYG